tara:strand:+ start:255 stop:443 length:189 start_codon:yes stop_codon:yes gene_type:complete
MPNPNSSYKQPRFGIQSKLETENTENGAKLSNYEQFGFLIFTECRSLQTTVAHFGRPTPRAS